MKPPLSDPRLTVLDHPVVAHKIALLRAIGTDVQLFRALVHEVALLALYEATRTLPGRAIRVSTPLEETDGVNVSGATVAIVPVLRAGLGMLDAALELLPQAPVGFIGVQRDEETLRPVPYYLNLPSGLAGRSVLVLDPMLATGGSAAHAVQLCREAGAAQVTCVSVIAAPEGVAAVLASDPGVHIVTATLDRGLNEVGYIVPGLGDAGDRLYGTL